MVSIPCNLQRSEFRFIPIKPRGKTPIEKHWPSVNNYRYDDDKFLCFLGKGYNYGVLGGYGDLVILDFDDPDLFKKNESKLPRTLISKTFRGYHVYGKNPALESRKFLDDNKKPLIEIQAKGKFVVGPNSIHEKGIIYQVYRDNDISNISDDCISSIVPKNKTTLVSSRHGCSRLMDGFQPSIFSREDRFDKRLCFRKPIEIEIFGLTPNLSPQFNDRKIILFLRQGKLYWTDIPKDAYYFLRLILGPEAFWPRQKVIMQAVEYKGGQKNTLSLTFSKQVITENENNKNDDELTSLERGDGRDK